MHIYIYKIQSLHKKVKQKSVHKKKTSKKMHIRKKYTNIYTINIIDRESI